MAEEAIDVKTNVEPQTTEPEPSTAEPNNDGVVAIGDENYTTEEETEAPAEAEPADKAPEEVNQNAEVPETNEPHRKNAETRKQQLSNEIRDKVAERNALKREIAELERKKHQLKSADDLPTIEALMEQQNPATGDYYTRTEAEIARLKAERELEAEQRKLDEYAEKVVDNRMQLMTEANKALKDFPIFDAESKEYNKELAELADNLVDDLIIKDEAGQIIGSHGSVYAVYDAINKAVQSAKTSGEIAGRKAAVDMMNSADIAGSSGGTSTKDDDDPFLKGLRRALNS